MKLLIGSATVACEIFLLYKIRNFRLPTSAVNGFRMIAQFEKRVPLHQSAKIYLGVRMRARVRRSRTVNLNQVQIEANFSFAGLINRLLTSRRGAGNDLQKTRVYKHEARYQPLFESKKKKKKKLASRAAGKSTIISTEREKDFRRLEESALSSKDVVKISDSKRTRDRQMVVET